MLLGSARVKAVYRMLMKLTAGGDVLNVYLTTFRSDSEQVYFWPIFSD